MENDIRWKQRLENYCKALAKLEGAVRVLNIHDDNFLYDLAKEGLIQRFEFTHELSWKVMKDYLEYQGISIGGSRDAFREALQMGLIEDKRWMQSIKARNLTSHTYDEDMAEIIYNEILSIYLPLMIEFRDKMLNIEVDERYRTDD
ncbi:MAG: nucleotidyltransferase substrate binding protein [Muribaculaceae bacterium]|nr:nucleotidyltransferase substrate binding protein [Muribaculaceae bacterium]